VEELFKKAGIEINAEQLKKFSKLLKLFKHWNSIMNLSSFNDDNSIIIKHFIDSLLPTKSNIFNSAESIADLGTGGGFPGMALAIIYPEKTITMVDSIQKKINSIKKMTAEIGLKNSKTICNRIEELGRNKKTRESFDIVTARALAKFSTMLEYCLPLCKVGGYVIAYQTPEIEKELTEKKDILLKLGGKIENIFDEILPLTNEKRKIIFIRKISATPMEFPRPSGTPKKKPL
jgi:16S rRNA (guanine527-N7)-methyltransferase